MTGDILRPLEMFKKAILDFGKTRSTFPTSPEGVLRLKMSHEISPSLRKPPGHDRKCFLFTRSETHIRSPPQRISFHSLGAISKKSLPCHTLPHFLHDTDVANLNMADKLILFQLYLKYVQQEINS